MSVNTNESIEPCLVKKKLIKLMKSYFTSMLAKNYQIERFETFWDLTVSLYEVRIIIRSDKFLQSFKLDQEMKFFTENLHTIITICILV